MTSVSRKTDSRNMINFTVPHECRHCHGRFQWIVLKKAAIMKNILVATDFSRAAHNACLYGAQLASAFNARLILFSAYQQVLVPIVEAPGVVAVEDMDKYAREQLAQEAALINRGEAIPVETVCLEGLVVRGIQETARKYDADVIITGMKNSGLGFRRLFGSTVTSLARYTAIPMIVVPDGVAYTKVDRMALANEADIEPGADGHQLQALGDIAASFGSRLYIVRVVQDTWQLTQQAANKPLRLLDLLRPYMPEYKCIEGKDIAAALKGFIKGYHIDMLALQPRHHSLFESWFVKSTTRSTVFGARVPLLILPAGKK